MATIPQDIGLFDQEPEPVRGLTALLLRGVLKRLAKGRLTIVSPAGRTMAHQAPEAGPSGTLVLHNWRALRRVIAGGDIGFADGYLAGDWSSPDLPALLELFAANVERMQQVLAGIAAVRLTSRLRHALRRNSKRQSRRNIAFHYDLGNDFYRAWLDESMTYSAAIAMPEGTTLDAAQAAKLDRIVELLGVSGGDRVLEIGFGWGALARRIAAAGAAVTGLTLSREQLELAAERVAGLDVDLRLQDYRDVDGQFDRIVSIEMIEAVGERYWPAYFETLRARLAPGGRVVLQVITIREDCYEDYRRQTDFIQKYVFPGGMLPSPSVLADQAGAAGLAITGSETFRFGYAATLAEWRRRFHAAWDEIAAMGFDDRFRRLWDYYLSYCEAGFRIGTIDVGLYVLEPTA